MSKVIDFNARKKEYLNKKDFFNLFLLYKSKEEVFITFDLDIFEKSTAIYKKNDQFAHLLSNFKIELNDNNEEIINFHEVSTEAGIIILENIVLLLNERYLKQYEKQYNSFIKVYDDLLFHINNDLKYGINNWNVVFKDKLNDKSKQKKKSKFTLLKKD